MVLQSVADHAGQCQLDLQAAQEELSACPADLQTANEAIAQTDAAVRTSVTSLQNDFRQVFTNPTFVVPGATPLEQLQALIQAVLGG